MKKMLAALALALTLPTCALGDSEGVIVQSSCNIVQSGDYYLAYCFAQVHNNASTVICLDQGTFDLQSGETLLSTSEVSQIWPYFLSPGEDGYLFDIVSFEPDENGNPVIPSITGISYNVTYLPVDSGLRQLRPFGGFGNRAGRIRRRERRLPPDQQHGYGRL